MPTGVSAGAQIACPTESATRSTAAPTIPATHSPMRWCGPHTRHATVAAISPKNPIGPVAATEGAMSTTAATMAANRMRSGFAPTAPATASPATSKSSVFAPIKVKGITTSTATSAGIISLSRTPASRPESHDITVAS